MVPSSRPACDGPAAAGLVLGCTADLPRRRPDLQARGLDGEMLVLDRVRGLIHQLNATAAFVWTRCTGDRALADIARDLADVFDIAPETAAHDVEETVAQLRVLQLVDTGADPRGSSAAA